MTVRHSLLAGAALALLTVGCDQQARLAQAAKIDSLTTVASDRDRLVAEVAANARMLSEIGVELSKVQSHGKLKLPVSETPEAARRDTVVQRVHLLAARVRNADSQLKASEEHLASMTHLSDSLRATLESTVVNFRQMVESQKVEIAALTARADSLTGVTVALRDTLTNTVTRDNIVYYVIGTKDDLIKRGLITEEGGSRFLFVLWKSGKTLVPARSLDPTAFTAIDRREVTRIALPDSAQTYRIVSRNDLAALGVTPADNGEIKGAVALPIAQPDKFWAGTKFLIIVES
jgi:hypothetical protein